MLLISGPQLLHQSISDNCVSLICFVVLGSEPNFDALQAF